MSCGGGGGFLTVGTRSVAVYFVCRRIGSRRVRKRRRDFFEDARIDERNHLPMDGIPPDRRDHRVSTKPIRITLRILVLECYKIPTNRRILDPR